jgi:uncharacterized protein (TIGR02145 family)
LNANVSTTNPTGYNLMIRGATATLVSAGADTIPAVGGTIASPVNPAANTWGFCVPSNAMTGVTNGFNASSTNNGCGGADGNTTAATLKYAAMPTTDTVIRSYATGAPTTTAQQNTPIWFGTRVNAGTKPGTYTNTITITASPNGIPLPTVAAISPTTANTSAAGTVLTVTGTNFMAGGVSVVSSVMVGTYTCGSINVSSATSLTCTLPAMTAGTYGVGVTTSGGSDTLATAFTATTVQYMQTFALSSCNSMATGATTTLTDARDSKQYTVRKMPDGKCWMIDNLAYVGGGTTTYGDTVTGSSVAFNATMPTTNGTLYEVTGAFGATTISAWTTAATAQRLVMNNSVGRNGVYNGTACTTGTVTGASPMDSTCGNQYLYNFCAANGLDAGTTPTCAAAADTTTGTGMSAAGIVGKAGGVGGESKGSGGSSICPATWRLPVGRVGSANTQAANTSNEFMLLMFSLNAGAVGSIPSTTATSYTTGYMGYYQPTGTSIGAGTTGAGTGSNAFGTVTAGFFSPSSGLSNQSTAAYWWSSSLYSSTYGANQGVNSSNVYPGTNYVNKYYGFTVRCVFP